MKKFLFIILWVVTMPALAQLEDIRLQVGYGNENQEKFATFSAISTGNIIPRLGYVAGMQIQTNDQYRATVMLSTPLRNFNKTYIELQMKYLIQSYARYNGIHHSLALIGLFDFFNHRLMVNAGVCPTMFQSTGSHFKTRVYQPLDFIYNLQYWFRRVECKLNFAIGINNYDYFVVDRLQTIYYKAEGRYRINSKLEVGMEAVLNPAGAFHFAAMPYGTQIRSSLIYRW